VVDLAPAGRLAAMPARLKARFLPWAGVDPESVVVTLDGREVTRECRVDGAGVEMALPPGLVADAPHVAVVRATHRSGRVEERTVSFEVDTRPPELEVLVPEAGATVGGTVRLEAAATDASGRVTVVVRVAGEKERRLKPVKDRPGVFAAELDAAGWAAGERFVWVVARDGVGNETERVVRVVKGE
jgi:hypothetical protein